MQSRNSRRNVMFLGASALAICGGLPATAFAQAGPSDTTVEEVVVTGQRAALQSAQKLKQNAEQLVDSITATDIGALPDRSVTEALQRVPGVTIGRTTDGRDADRISVEGSGVQIRGISWVRGELNGRDSFSAKAGRTLSFEDVPPELMAGVDVYKNPSADIIEGGVGGTVNLRTRLPFDSAKRVLAYSVDSSWGDLAKHWQPSGSVLYSDRWDTKYGEVGFLVDLSDSKLSSRTDTISVDPYYVRTDLEPGRTVYVPGGFGYRTLEYERERKGIAAALQWRPNDQWEASLQFLRSSAMQSSTEHAVGFNVGQTNWPAAGTSFTYDSSGHFIKGTLAQSQTDNTSLGSSTIDARYADRSSVTSDYALNVKYTPNDKWAFSGDIQYVYAKTKTVDNTAFNSLNGNAAPASLDLTDHLPVITMNNDTAFTSNPANYYLIAAMDHHDRNEAAEWAERFDGDYTFDEGGWLKSFRFGVRHTFRQATTRETSYRWDTVAPSWSAPSIDNLAGYQGYYGLYPFDNYFRGKAHLPATFVMPSSEFVNNYGDTSLVLSRIAQANGGGWRPFNGDFEDQTQSGGKGSTNHQKEETLAGFGLLRFGNDVTLWGDQREIDGNFGVRIVKTETQSQGLQVFTANTNPVPPADQAFANGAKAPYKGGRDYVNILPSLNVRLKITPDMFVRFAAAKAIVRPDFQQLQPNYPIAATNGTLVGGTCSNVGASLNNCVYQYTANAGNPDLKPTRSTQFDLAYEWYFNQTGSLTATVFYKDIYNFITNGSTVINFTNNGVTRPVQVVQPYNAGHGTIKGYEVAYQQYFDFLPGALRGLGVQANYTYVDSKGTRNAASNPYDTNQTGNVSKFDEEMPLEGLSPTSYNLAGLYDLGKVSARVAYNWRERYLLTTTAANINIPAWYDDYGQLDASIFYTVNDALKIGFQAANLTNAETRIMVSYPGRPEEGLTDHNWVVADRRYTIALRGTF